MSRPIACSSGCQAGLPGSAVVASARSTGYGASRVWAVVAPARKAIVRLPASAASSSGRRRAVRMAAVVFIVCSRRAGECHADIFARIARAGSRLPPIAV
jgi:hypothetical protein